MNISTNYYIQLRNHLIKTDENCWRLVYIHLFFICSFFGSIYFRFSLQSCFDTWNAQRYEIVNGATEVEGAPEDAKMDQGDEKTAEGILSLFAFVDCNHS